jgi:hypothetical protein
MEFRFKKSGRTNLEENAYNILVWIKRFSKIFKISYLYFFNIRTRIDKNRIELDTLNAKTIT